MSPIAHYPDPRPWRHRDRSFVTITYVAAVRPPRRLGTSLAALLVRPQRARGAALEAPARIETHHVVGMRHLPWLWGGDPAVHAVIAGWGAAWPPFRTSSLAELGHPAEKSEARDKDRLV